MLKISEVKVYPSNNKDSKLKAYASLKLADEFVITGIKVFNGSKGKFVAMPASKDAQGEWHDVCFPINKDLREAISTAVLTEYENR